MPPGTPDEVQPPAEPLRHGITPQHDDRPFMQFPPPPLPPRRPGLRLSSARKAALWAGLIAGVGAAVPFAPFIILCMVAAGGMSIAFYMRSEPNDEVRTSSGLKMGALAGLFGFSMYAIVASLSLLSVQTRTAFRSDMATALKEAAARSADPSRAADMIRPFVDRLNTPGGLATMFLMMLFFLLVFFVLLSGVGGAIGASLFGHRRH
jgi:hypothetical protein